MNIQTVGVFLKHDQPQAADTLRSLLKWLSQRDLEVRVDQGCARWTDLSATPERDLASGVDLIIALGGDGTLLRVARCSGTRRVPILGVNLGTLGFLTEINVEEMLPALERVFAGEVEVVSRMRLEVVVARAGAEVGCFQALNDAVINQTALSRLVELETRVDGVEVTQYHADGLIVATPTGSTAYSLSAGGPILMPGSQVIVMTPICPHALTQRPVVLPQSAQIGINVRARGGRVALTVDGQEGIELSEGDEVAICRSSYPVDIISSPFRNRYEILRAKLRWGQR